ncbi:MAG: von Willebrand factor type A [Ignavibacteria bacterium]|nr:MAG: von Willebrand factor type A [Ignavibacteria bacterium]KAF0161121.1 MAG: von Willebrand factor type A [Ignavibacteria bacterium]
MTVKAQDFRKFLDPSVVSKLKTLELRARMVVEGFMVGLHKSPYHGFSVEFSQHRPYMQGDSLKNIDWKVYAKSEKYFIKQFEEETNLISNIFLDISNSMNFKYDAQVTKLDYATNLAAALSYIMINQQDSVGLATYSEAIQSYLPPKSNRVYLTNLLTALANVKPQGNTNFNRCLDSVAEKIKKRGLTIIISDFFDDTETTISALKRIHFKKNEVIVFQILDPIEKSFGFDRDAIFVDLESGEKMTSQPHHIQKAYQEAMREFLCRIKTECLNLGIEYNLIETNQPFDKALMAYFSKRRKLS